ncbi:MAG: DUF4124 domain-containing protein [Piscinibacter sp.]|nr:DUF4124 domain-containing protein [Piscinibacter sp.]
MRRRLPALFALMLGIALALPAAAQWKWRDGGGRIQYSDLPPPAGVPEKDILQRPASAVTRQAPAFVAAPASAASAPPLAAAGKEPELEAKRKAAEKEQAEKAKAEEQKLAAARAENCQRARSHARSLESGLRMARVNEKGEREIIDDNTRAAEMKRAQDVIASDCKQ